MTTEKDKIQNSVKTIMDYQFNIIRETINKMKPLLNEEELKKGFIKSQQDTLDWLKDTRNKKCQQQ